MNSIVVNQVAPNFSLYNTEKQKISLSDFKGKGVLIHFFPLAFTGVCTQQLCTSRDNMGLYNNRKVEVLGISVDSLFTLEKFKQENKLSFHLLSDFNKDVSKSYGAFFETFPAFEYKGVSKRASFVIDKEGKVVYAEVLDVPSSLPNFDAINKVIEQL